jgi:hypothetical protein
MAENDRLNQSLLFVVPSIQKLLKYDRSRIYHNSWSMVDGRWSMVDGRWLVVDGRWLVVDDAFWSTHYVTQGI